MSNVQMQVLDGSLRAAADKVGSELLTSVTYRGAGAVNHRERANASEPHDRSKPTKRLARECIRGAAGAKPPGLMLGGPRRDRTCDPLVKSQVLYH